MDRWFTQIQSKIFTRLEYMLKYVDNAPFPDLNCTTGNANNEETEFPTLYMQTLGIIEQGRDLDNKGVNAVSYSAQIRVVSDEDDATSLNIAYEAIEVLKGMRFNITMLPLAYTENNIHVASFRFTRKIGAQDEL
jgi:hypothetical protein